MRADRVPHKEGGRADLLDSVDGVIRRVAGSTHSYGAAVNDQRRHSLGKKGAVGAVHLRVLRCARAIRPVFEPPGEGSRGWSWRLKALAQQLDPTDSSPRLGATIRVAAGLCLAD